MIRGNPWLVVGGAMSAAAALAHLGCIVVGPDAYRFFGAGERIATMAEEGRWAPAVLTMGIATMLGVAAVYAWSGAGLIRQLPLLRTGLVVITAVYLARGLIVVQPSMLARPDLSSSFMLWSSLIVLIIGLVHLVGLWQTWTTLALGRTY